MNKIKNWGSRIALGVGGALATGAAFAQDTDLAATVTGELTGGKTQLLTVGGAVLVLVAVVALIRHIRSAAR
jgi:hypothetical protein